MSKIEVRSPSAAAGVTSDEVSIIKVLTQAAYDALGGSVVATTLYVIVG